ncbi:AMP-binding enzyme domain-containingprotein [Purpureocillium lavendulum]|uniref:AMP-binding enzyme domain-containingprotein n=1 Tax=Purpureocillium lavendulum TaxID=1247861 RepID=A0AB34FSN8_9HYPO|nr:AMP-binding enzyme domain-containingprotein [Purpureocillium lavendulum]
MVFASKLPKIDAPATDVFNFIFNTGRDSYPGDRVLYRVHETGESLTFDALENKSRRLASVLASKYNIKSNDVIAFLANNSIHYPIAYFAALAVGATISPIPVQQGLDVLAVLPRLQQADAKLIVTDEGLAEVSHAAAKAYNGIPLISVSGSLPEIPSVEDLVTAEPAPFNDFRLATRGETEDHYAFIYRTSDTNPETDVWVSSLPFAYGINAKLNLGLNVLLGIPVIILLKPFDQTSLHLIDRYGITFLFVTPPLAAQIAKAPKVDGVTYKSIKWLLSAGAPVHTKIRDAVQEKFNGTKLTLEWGTTETLLIALQIDEESSVPGSSGTLVHGIEARVIDLDSKEDLGHNQQGEILVRNTLARFAGYKDNAEANKDFDKDGWFHSGDVGYVDERSNVFIVDRLKELLRVGDGYGTHASADEFEAALFDHPAVSTAVVVGIRDPDTQQEHPTGFVVLQPAKVPRDDAAKAQELAQLASELEGFVEGKLGKFKRLSGGVYFVSEYPYVGYKINRRRLKELVRVGDEADTSNRWVAVAA